MNHGIFHVYHFWNFLIFNCTWVCSSSLSKNKNIFLNLSINSINSNMSTYLSISKIMCSSLFSRGNQVCARIANAKRYWRSLETQHYQQWPNALDLSTGALTLATSALLWKQKWNSWHLLRNNEHIFSWFYGYYRLDFEETCAHIVLSTMCANDRNFVFPHGRRGHFYCCLWPVLNKIIVFYEFILRQ